MLNTERIMAFLAVTDKERAKAFYGETLGLPLVEEDPYAMVFDANGTLLRISPMPSVATASYTVLGWEVESISSALEQLAARGVQPERWPGFVLDEQGAFTFPDGTQVAWFKDPDGNVLSVTQYKNRPGSRQMDAAKPVAIRFKGAFSISGDTEALPVKDFGPAIAFYTHVLGFKTESRTSDRVILRRDDAVIGLAKNGADPEQASVFFSVENVTALHAELTATGVEPSAMRPDTYNRVVRTIFFAKEPYGVCFCFGEPVA